MQPNSQLPQVMDSIRRREPWPAMPLTEEGAAQAFASVLRHAGASCPHRDTIDERIVEEVRTGRASYEGTTYKAGHDMTDKRLKSGIIDSQNDVGGWPELKSTTPPQDTDHDGMPDEWERQRGLNLSDPADGAQLSPDGIYTHLEVYLNSICSQ